MDKYGTPREGFNDCLHDLPADRALSLLDQEQSDERAAGAGAVCRDSGRIGRRVGHQGRRKSEGFQRPRPLHREGDGDRRIKPMTIDGKKTYQIGIPIHWGIAALTKRRQDGARRWPTCFLRR